MRPHWIEGTMREDTITHRQMKNTAQGEIMMPQHLMRQPPMFFRQTCGAVGDVLVMGVSGEWVKSGSSDSSGRNSQSTNSIIHDEEGGDKCTPILPLRILPKKGGNFLIFWSILGRIWGRIRIGVIPWGFTAILIPILPWSYHKSYLKIFWDYGPN